MSATTKVALESFWEYLAFVMNSLGVFAHRSGGPPRCLGSCLASCTLRNRGRASRPVPFCLSSGSGEQHLRRKNSRSLAACNGLGWFARSTGSGAGTQPRQYLPLPRSDTRLDLWGCSFFNTDPGTDNEAAPQGSGHCRWTSLSQAVCAASLKSGDVKGTIRSAVPLLLVSNDIRRHRLISISYISLLPCHGTVRWNGREREDTRGNRAILKGTIIRCPMRGRSSAG